MWQVIDQWDCLVAEFEDREDALAYIALREQAYKGQRASSPHWTIREGRP